MTSDVFEQIYAQHDSKCNQFYYNNIPYSFHLKNVVELVRIHSNHITGKERYAACIAAAGHDLIEDARMSYNDVKHLCGEEAAEVIYLLTEHKGKTRAERHSDLYYGEIGKCKIARLVKLCDIMANVTFSLATSSPMLKTYKNEFPRVKSFLYRSNEFEKLWSDLETIINL